MAPNVFISDILIAQICTILAEQPVPLIQGRFAPIDSVITALSTIKIVDASTTLATANQTGSWSAPYKTVTQANAALALTGGVILIVPADYSAEPAIAVNAPSAVSFVNLAGLQAIGGTLFFNPVLLPALTGSAPKYIQGCVCSTIGATAGQVECVSCTLNGDITCTNFFLAKNCTIQPAGVGPHVVAPFVNVSSSRIVSTGVVFACNPASQSQVLNTDILSAGGTLVAYSVAGGRLLLDPYSESQRLFAGYAITNGIPLAFTSLQRATVSIVVPALAGGALGYADGSIAGTALDGLLQPDSPIICNPQSDLAAAGAGNGGLINARAILSGGNIVVHAAFVGALAGGAANFTVAMASYA